MVDLSVIINPLLRTVGYGGLLVAMAVAGWFIYHLNKFKYTCIIYEKRAEGRSQIFMDRGAFVKLKSGDFIFQLLKRRHKIKPPDNKYIFPLKTKNVIHLRHLGSDIYIPFNPDFPETEEDEFLMKLDYDETLSWNLSMKERLKTALDFRTMWEKYGMLIISMIAFLMTIAAIYLILQFAEGTIADLTGSVREQTSFLQDLFTKQATEGAPQ
jgi:hypothetical protein